MSHGRILAVSIDLDGIGCYHAIHGLGDPDPGKLDLHYTLGACRFLDLVERSGIKATLFAIGSDLARPACAAVLRRAHGAGHEIANHTQDHPYRLTALETPQVRSQIDECSNAILAATGIRPRGFRAPGYLVDGRLLSLLASLGYAWDSSILPSPPYVAAKLGVMAMMALRGRRSMAAAGGAAMAVAPAVPYRTGSPWWTRGEGIPELPCAVMPVSRLPFIGTTLALAGRMASATATRLMASRRFVGLEFHAVDFLDASSDGLEELARFQPDLRIVLERKRSTFARVLEDLLARGFEPMTLSQAADRLLPPGSERR